MARIKIFTKDNCPKCPKAHELASVLKQQKVDVIEYNVNGSTDAMAEAAFHSVMSTPSIIIVDNKDEEIVSWRGEVPRFDEILKTVRAQ